MYSPRFYGDSHTNPYQMSDSKPYTVEDPDGNPITTEPSDSQYARDTGRSARSHPDHEANGNRERGSRRTLPHQVDPRRHRTRSDSPLGDPHRRDSLDHSIYSDGSDVETDGTLSDHENHRVRRGSLLAPGKGFYGLAKDFDLPKKKASSSRHRRDDIGHEDQPAYEQGAGRVRFDVGSDIPYSKDAHPFPQDTYGTRRHNEQDSQNAGAMIRYNHDSKAMTRYSHDSRAIGSQESRTRRDDSRGERPQPPQRISRSYQGYGPDGKYWYQEEVEYYEEHEGYQARRRVCVGGVDSESVEELGYSGGYDHFDRRSRPRGHGDRVTGLRMRSGDLHDHERILKI